MFEKRCSKNVSKLKLRLFKKEICAIVQIAIVQMVRVWLKGPAGLGLGPAGLGYGKEVG